jgi:hypothetical protein
MTAADPTFCRLCADITLARDVEQLIRRGEVDREHIETIKELERRAWKHLAEYVDATAFVSDLTV